MADLERPRIKVGFIPIIDCAAIVLAEELGAYERQGLEVEIRREVSWANVRDKLALGALDASHILAPLPLALTLGIDSVSVPVINAMTLEVNGNALTLSKSLWQEMEETAPQFVGDGRAPLDARAIAAVVARRAANGAKPLVLASVFPYSVQNYMLRLWLSSARARSRSRRPPCRGAAAAHRRLSVGRRDRRLLRRRALEPAIRSARHRPHRAHRPGHLEGHAGEGAGNHRVLGGEQSANPEGTDQGVDRSLPVARRAGQPRRGRAHPVEPALSQHARRSHVAHPRPARTSTSSSATRPTFPGAAMPTGSWRRWCAGSRRRPTPTSRPSPIASIAPTSTAPRRATWESTAPMSTACRPAAMANLFCRQCDDKSSTAAAAGVVRGSN